MRLFVGSLDWDATEDDLRAAFGTFGVVKEANVVFDRDNGKSRGFGFVTMESVEEAEHAMTAMDGAIICGRKIVVNEARPRENRGGRERA